MTLFDAAEDVFGPGAVAALAEYAALEREGEELRARGRVAPPTSEEVNAVLASHGFTYDMLPAHLQELYGDIDVED